MEKILKIYTYVDGVNDKPFPNADAQIEVFSFNYDAKRMGGAPTISASVMYKDCLDKLWSGKEYVIYNGERYKLKQTPTSSKNNSDARYKHDLELVALRVVLDYVYFFDAVVENTPVDDKPVTNSTKFVFSGDIHEFAKRLNASLKYTKLDYSVVVDNGITSETKFLSFDAQPISSVLQEIYKQYEIPYYFVGNVIHIGFTSNAIAETFKYGADNALLSITKTNANNKIVNRCTGVGSSDNIPYYYPNEHPLGEVEVLYNKEKNNSISIKNPDKFGGNVKLSTVLTYTKTEMEEKRPSLQYYDYTSFLDGEKTRHQDLWRFGEWWEAPMEMETTYGGKWESYGDYKGFNPLSDVFINISSKSPSIAVRIILDESLFKEDRLVKLPYEIDYIVGENDEAKEYKPNFSVKYYYRSYLAEEIDGINGFKPSSFAAHKDEYAYVVFTLTNPPSKNESIGIKINVKVNFSPTIISYDWKDENDVIRELAYYGLSYSGATNIGDVISFEQVRGSLIPFQNTLMPPVYWQTKGAESFYNAFNDTYISPETGSNYTFENEYSDENRREHKETFEYVKPSIEYVRNGENIPKPINMFLEFAYDVNDSDEVGEDGNYLHPYFFAKLRKFNGENGFNLFDHANEKGEMTISMTSGDCGACNFAIGVQEGTQKNIVQVNEDGTLARDDNGNVQFGVAQDRQNDTINNEVWVALKKDASTFPDIMPNATYKNRPKACTNADTNDGDTFVITNISLPTAYIREAEERLKEEIIKYMSLNNSEKFTFSIKFSRIYLAENPDILAQLNENARIQIEYNGLLYELYVSSYQYKVVDNEVLPEIIVELADSLSTNENALQQAINAVEHSIMSSVGSIDFYKQGLKYFIRKDVEDFARGLLHFTKGATFGANDIAKIDEQGNAEFVSQIIRQFISTPKFIDGFTGEGFKLWLDDNGKSNLTVDNITARETFRVFEMLVTKLRAVNGGLFISAANGTIKSVSESSDGLYYDILLENENTFIAGDYMRSQTMRGTRYSSYWVEVFEVDGNICRVAKSEFGFSLPEAGQDVVLCGSKNINRQNAIHISATDDNQPRISIYNGITTKNLTGCLRTQLGNLNNIEDDVLKPQGDGLYSDNAYLKGDFVLRSSGQSVETQFEITGEGLKSAVGTLQNDAEHGKTILYNPSFTKDVDGWITSNVAIYYLLGEDLVFNQGMLVYNDARDNANPDYNNHRFILNINNGSIKQLNEYFVNKPEIKVENRVSINLSLKAMVEEDGFMFTYLDSCEIDQKKATAFSFVANNDYEVNGDLAILTPAATTFCFRTLLGYTQDGTNVINIGDKVIIALNGNDTFTVFNVTKNAPIRYRGVEYPETTTSEFVSVVGDIIVIGQQQLTSNNDYQSLEYTSTWNGTGNFNLAFTGGVSIYSVQLYSNSTEVRYATLFEQTDKLLKMAARNFNADGTIKEESGLVVQSGEAGLYAKSEDGTQSKIAAYANGKILLEGEQIQLKGNLTVDGNFKVREDGSIEARHALFNGFVQLGTMYINDTNYDEFFKRVGNTGRDKMNVTTASPILIFEFTKREGVNFYDIVLPSLDVIITSGGNAKRAELEYARGFIGCSVLIYNYTDATLNLSYHESDGTTASHSIESGKFSRLECKFGVISRNGISGEFVYWENVLSGAAIEMSKE